MFTKLLQWCIGSQLNEIEYYILSHNPKTTADIELLLNEFNRKRSLQCF